jgi:hypothetical protein
VLPDLQMQLPLAQAPLHEGLSPSHATWHGGASQAKSHSAPASQVQLPLAHAAVQLESSSQTTVQGGASQLRSQVSPGKQWHEPFSQSGSSPQLATMKTMARVARAERQITRRA